MSVRRRLCCAAIIGSMGFFAACNTNNISTSGATPPGSASSVVGPFAITNLVADKAALASGDGAASAAHVDANLVNPWGLSIAPGAPAWIANNGSQTSTLYDGEGDIVPLVVTLPNQSSRPAATQAANPSGIVFNSGAATDFVIGSGATAGHAVFLFDGEDGIIYGWSQAAGAQIVFTATDGASYKGLALANNGSGTFLYATDFENNKVDVFNNTFSKASNSTTFPFVDPNLPAGYAPYGIQALPLGTGGTVQIAVTYAKPDGGTPVPDNVGGAGLGLVDLFDANGVFIKTLVPAGGRLNGPWGIALAPADFGTLAGALLIGNFGDGGTTAGGGQIDAYNPSTGKFVGIAGDRNGNPLAIPGLWALAFGNDASGLQQPHNTLFFTAGTNSEGDGTYGRIDAGANPPTLPTALVITAPAAASNVSATVTVTAQVQDVNPVSSVSFAANGTTIGTASAPPFSVQWNTTTGANGSVALTATATDSAGHTLNATAVNVTVANAAAATTLSQLQTQFFTPICSVCHTGVGSTLPGSMDLTSGHAFASLVNVASVEKSTLSRIKPNDPTNSYLIQKIEGAAGIVGAQMPDGCPTTQPCLTQAQINEFSSWVNAGAPNN